MDAANLSFKIPGYSIFLVRRSYMAGPRAKGLRAENAKAVTVRLD